MTDALEPFDITGQLPTGTTLLEASAGTGKTWTIAALVTRFVAEGVVRLDEMLVVTFGRAASQELRERVRAQLVEAQRALAPEPVLPDEPSALLGLLLARDDREAMHARLVDALVGFDAATIATTHQFCHLVLASLGVAGDSDSNTRLVEDLDDLLVEVVDDLYLRGFATTDDGPSFSYSQALAIARCAVNDPQARLEPAGETEGVAARRVRFAEAVRRETDRRKRRLGVLSYDDLLHQLADALADTDSPARDRMRRRWRVVLVDEFQDTDPVQWSILDRAFTGVATMVLIGDPKQAIYAFRGGDVTTYLAAARTATERRTLGTNWRSDHDLVAAFDAFLGGAQLGHPEIVVHPVDAHHGENRLRGAPSDRPLRMRVLRRDDLGVTGGAPKVDQVRPHVARDLALDVRRLLASGATFDGEPLRARDVAVLAHTNSTLATIQAALREVGIPSVIAGAGSVFGSAAALEWLTLLEALDQPHRMPKVRAAALTSFFGLTATELDEGGADRSEEIADQVRVWAELFAERGVAAVLEAATAAGLSARVLGWVGGERLLTDLRHVGEVLHTVGLTDHLGLASTLTWLRRQVAEGRADRTSERTRRLDSDAAAVQLVTIHSSKGLEYPVVYLPAVWDRFAREPDMPLFHDDDGQRCVAVGRSRTQWGDHAARAAAEDLGESLRLLYVALTRACSQVVCWWAPTARNTATSALHRLLARGEGDDVPDQAAVWSDQQVVDVFARWRDRGALTPEPARWALLGVDPPQDHPAELAVRRFDRTVDTAWRRTSYSALTRVESATATVDSEPEVEPRDDEGALRPLLLPDDVVSAAAVPSPMADLPVGADFGSLVHGVLEHADPEVPDLAAELRRHLDDQLVRWPQDVDRDVLVDALEAVVTTPLGSLAGGATLRSIALRDRLPEMDFELPLAGGDLATTGAVTLGDLAPLLRRHLTPEDPVRRFADALDRPEVGDQDLRGYLTGSVDVVLRTGPASDPRYLVVDYKTNWLGPREEPLTAAAYAPAMLDEAMGHSDYPLQALLYAAVLHRFLRWRQPGYDPERHLGGVLYLYLRGMCGEATPLVDGEPCGVFAWRPPVALVVELSDLLDGRVVVT
ncbi:UvrD-helicase domain-containing protein [Nocardioides coralli]|uniref:UvrD-helicase domain-containing protein n=1 Tax=Nocardioides coralli TaxID=2872154 RepID=UPI001CA39354|nr:UvrD-helicase domain-containing protein [Nocardioides coralli]QZY29300.1 UvrD-helicase domain-containing protein [Nocardioides coralli]